MTDEQINAAIAKKCGWTEIRDNVVGKAPGETGYRVMFLPKYSTSLNAMHEAEKVLTEDRNSYLTTLAGLVETDHLRGLDADWPWVCATARQRAEAFLKTLGKWEEKK
jgi:hypothetical protein